MQKAQKNFASGGKSAAEGTSYLPAGRGAPKAWKDWGNGGGAISGFSKRFQRKNISSVVATTGVCPGLHQYQHPS